MRPVFQLVMTPSRPGRLRQADERGARGSGGRAWPSARRCMPTSKVRTLSLRRGRRPAAGPRSPRRCQRRRDRPRSPPAGRSRRAPPRVERALSSPPGSGPSSIGQLLARRARPRAGTRQADQRAVSASQVARSRLVSSGGSPVPPASEAASGLVMFPLAGPALPVSRCSPANAAASSSRSW